MLRRLIAGGLLVIAVAGCSPESAAQPAEATRVTERTANTLPPVTTRPKPKRPALKLVVGRYCAIMRTAGWSYGRAAAYYEAHGRPAHMDADGDGVPCETVYPEAVPPTVYVPSPTPEAPTYSPPPIPDHWRTPGGNIDHDWPTNPGPGSSDPDRPIQPGPAFPGDPNDADGDGVACEYGCKN
jgi:excalibur calcium-binding domain-containing protein